MDFNCNSCEYLDVTEEKQNELLKTLLRHVPHVCTKYDVRVKHLGQHPYIQPCTQCLNAHRIAADICSENHTCTCIERDGHCPSVQIIAERLAKLGYEPPRNKENHHG